MLILCAGLGETLPYTLQEPSSPFPPPLPLPLPPTPVPLPKISEGDKQHLSKRCAKR